ncbi:hypothetical protein D3C72_2088030 [compost metagenome]
MLESANGKFRDGKEFASAKLADLGDSVPESLTERLAARWKDLAAFATAAVVFVVALRKLLKK